MENIIDNPSDKRFEFSLINHRDERKSLFQGYFRNINVLMGENGSGKSYMLGEISNNSRSIFGLDYNIVFVEGGRAINIDVNVGLDGNSMQIYDQPETHRKTYLNDRRGGLSGRVHRTFRILSALENSEKLTHSDAVTVWQQSGAEGSSPRRPQPPVQRLKESFSAIFPELNLTITPMNQMYIKKGDQEYPVSSMSDGEKQIFILMSDLLLLGEDKSLFIVDEPELNLHPTLAEAFWELIEAEYPNSIFLYATHSMAFALRSSVETLHVLKYKQIERDDLSFSSLHLRPFLGSMSRLHHRDPILFVEGDDLSFDKTFYQWLLNGKQVTVTPIGSSNSVKLASARQGLWQAVSPDLPIAGVIDRDFKGDSHPDLSGNNLVVLSYHEAESYLCHPNLIEALSRKLHNLDILTTSEIATEMLAQVAAPRKHYVAAQRLFSETFINLKLSVEKRGLSDAKNVEILCTILGEAAAEEASKANNIFDATRVSENLMQNISLCDAAIDRRNIEDILRIFEGKKFLASACKLSGCATPSSMLKSVIKHFLPDDFDHTKALSTAIKSALLL